MGSFDFSCAICGGPFCPVEISPVSRTPVFPLRQARLNSERRARGLPRGHPVHGFDDFNDDEEYDEEQLDSLEPYEAEEWTYDPDIISEDDTEWLPELYVLVRIAVSEGEPSVARVSGPGSQGGHGDAFVVHGNSPIWPQMAPKRFQAYLTGAFPFHWQCFELLLTVLTGTVDKSQVDIDRLHYTMERFGHSPWRWLNLDYGYPSLPKGQFWQSIAGEEFLAICPTPTAVSSGLVRMRMKSIGFKMRSSSPAEDPGASVKADPFSRIPSELLTMTLVELPLETVLILARESWPVHQALGCGVKFWRSYVRHAMPWFTELLDLLQDDDAMAGRDTRQVCLWADHMSKPRWNMDRDFMVPGNRRRIWGVCQQLGEKYFAGGRQLTCTVSS